MNQIFGKSLAEVLAGENLPVAEVYPGTPGIVITSRSEARKMTWGFPLALKGKAGQPLRPRPINNARTDKLGGPFWSGSMRQGRCLIPVDRFVEAEGPKGQMTRTWYAMPDLAQFHCAGLWRESIEWGPVYAMVMTEACGTVARIHDRMPVIVEPDNFDNWLSGAPVEATDLCRPYTQDLLEVRSEELWVRR